MTKNKISPEVREARAMNMRRLHLKRLVAAGKGEEAAEYARKNGMLAPAAPTMPEPEVTPLETITKAQTFAATAAPRSNTPDAGTTPLVIESKLSAAAQDRIDFQRQIDADIAAELDAIAPTIKITPTVAAQAPDVPVPKPPTDLDFADTGVPAKAPPPRPVLPWPEKTTGEILAQCPNPALVILRIADGRRCTMFNYGVRPWQVGAKNIKVKINQRRGPEAIYETDRT